MKKIYQVKKTVSPPELNPAWNKGIWGQANVMVLNEVRVESSEHHPHTELKLLHNSQSIFGMFRVQDQYVRAVRNGYQTSVSNDSCVEFFFKPKTEGGYFNFEFNCSGAMLCYYIVDPTRIREDIRESCKPPGEFVDYTPLSFSDLRQVKIYHSMPDKVDPEITRHVKWFLGFELPLGMLRKYSGDSGGLSGKIWEANCYKCASESSHPHWLSWNPIDKKDFHLKNLPHLNVKWESHVQLLVGAIHPFYV